jgi:hypothetical protein
MKTEHRTIRILVLLCGLLAVLAAAAQEQAD